MNESRKWLRDSFISMGFGFGFAFYSLYLLTVGVIFAQTMFLVAVALLIIGMAMGIHSCFVQVEEEFSISTKRKSEEEK